MIIRICPDPGALAELAAATIADILDEAVGERGQCHLALAGGSTPVATYQTLATRYAHAVRWPQVHFFWGDERLVPPDHSQSNLRMARESLLDPLGVAEVNVHPVQSWLGSPQQVARDYTRLLCTAFGIGTDIGTDDGEMPCFDLVLLGLGEDGHTASLVPGCEALAETRQPVAPCTGGVSPPRVTLTLPVLAQARRVVFLVSGEAKAEILHRVLQGPPQPDRLPAQLVARAAADVCWLVDASAAGRLTDGIGDRA
jgi:6-phosphogluconolactonase